MSNRKQERNKEIKKYQASLAPNIAMRAIIYIGTVALDAACSLSFCAIYKINEYK